MFALSESSSESEDEWASDLESTPGTATVFEARDEIIQEILADASLVEDRALAHQRRKDKVR